MLLADHHTQLLFLESLVRDKQVLIHITVPLQVSTRD